MQLCRAQFHGARFSPGFRLTRTAAQALRCQLIQQADVAVEHQGTETRQTLGLRRRLDALFDAYLPGVTARPCY